MKIITFVLIITLILILMLPNKKPNTDQTAKSGCGCKSNVESYSNMSTESPPPDPIQYIIADSTQLDLFCIKYTGKHFGWEFSGLPTTLTSTAKYKPKSPLDTIDSLYGKLSLAKVDSQNKVIYDANGNNLLADPNDNTVTKIMRNIQYYIKSFKVEKSNIKLYDDTTGTYVYVDTKNRDIAQLIAELDFFKNEAYTSYMAQVDE